MPHVRFPAPDGTCVVLFLPPFLVFSSTTLSFLPDLSSILSGHVDGPQNCVWCGIPEFPSFGDLYVGVHLLVFGVSYTVCSIVL